MSKHLRGVAEEGVHDEGPDFGPRKTLNHF